eukprot:scaffold25784_cov152-Cylindrotheca_fusiformis.AAC.3
MFLAYETWSPRFEKRFFSFQMKSAKMHSSVPASSGTPASAGQLVVKGKQNHPAYYYRIDVYCGHEHATVYRRYSQFYWLYKQLSAFQKEEPLVMPPGSCFWRPQNDAFANNRREQLNEFLEDALQLPEMASHPAVHAFLDLGAVSS